jgi:rod shape-determining protein MreC
MKYLPKDSDIKKSDIILTSGLTNIYPKGLAVGTVVDIGQEFSSITNYAIIRPAVDFSALEEVLVIIP